MTTKDNGELVLKRLGLKYKKNNIFEILHENYDYESYKKIFREISLGVGGKYNLEKLPQLLKKREELILEYQTAFPQDQNLDWVYNMDGFDDFRKKYTFGSISKEKFMEGVEKHALVASISDITSRITETLIVLKNEEVFPTLKHSGGVDYFFRGKPRDLKNSKSVGKLFLSKCEGKNPIEFAIQNPELVLKCLYEGQSQSRFGSEPRHLIVNLENKIVDNEKLIEKLESIDLSDEKNITFKNPKNGVTYTTSAIISYI